MKKINKNIIIFFVIGLIIFISYVSILNKNFVSLTTNRLKVDFNNMLTNVEVSINDMEMDVNNLYLTSEEEKALLEKVNELKINFTIKRSKLDEKYFSGISKIERERFYIANIVDLDTGRRFNFRVAKLGESTYEGRYYANTPLLFTPFGNYSINSWTNIFFEYDNQSAGELYRFFDEILEKQVQ